MNKTLSILTLIFAILCAISLLGAHANLGEIRTLVVLNSTLPRILTALLCGALLSLSSLLLCAITHNPLASDSTSGVSASSAFGVLFFGAVRACSWHHAKCVCGRAYRTWAFVCTHKYARV
ncbi:iron chelate uptake ABC transporter family permease subunit [Campylobacter sp. JMF_02 ED1]|nr:MULTISPECIES: iron chelate uptake ABC transporter family permease subunit [unclassified Campylobacter]MDA3049357.1 iron chelate uptake ABC transporter family permease subunit [Campylobacter sp. JMF_15 NE4]MDA3051215.1 iron chelate uptake ABC transporter family permease subunit [Campylobacter sp. JMF_02 ED1]